MSSFAAGWRSLRSLLQGERPALRRKWVQPGNRVTRAIEQPLSAPPRPALVEQPALPAGSETPARPGQAA